MSVNDLEPSSRAHTPTHPSETAAKIIYVLYLVGLLTGGLTTFVGLVMAYVYCGDAPEWLKTHFQCQIRLFWIGLLYLFLGFLLTIFLVGILILIGYVIWVIVRCVKGLKALGEGRAYPNHTSWGF